MIRSAGYNSNNSTTIMIILSFIRFLYSSTSALLFIAPRPALLLLSTSSISSEYCWRRYTTTAADNLRVRCIAMRTNRRRRRCCFVVSRRRAFLLRRMDLLACNVGRFHEELGGRTSSCTWCVAEPFTSGLQQLVRVVLITAAESRTDRLTYVYLPSVYRKNCSTNTLLFWYTCICSVPGTLYRSVSGIYRSAWTMKKQGREIFVQPLETCRLQHAPSPRW